MMKRVRDPAPLPGVPLGGSRSAGGWSPGRRPVALQVSGLSVASGICSNYRSNLLYAIVA